MISVEEVTAVDIARFYGGIRLEDEFFGYAQKKGRLVVGIGAILKTSEGPWRGFMDIPPHAKSPMIYRHGKRLMDRAKHEGAEVLRVTCDDTVPRAAVFLKRLGFSKTEETELDMAVWEWRV